MKINTSNICSIKSTPRILPSYKHKLPIKRLYFESISSTQKWAIENFSDFKINFENHEQIDWIEVSAGEQTDGIGTRNLGSTDSKKWYTPKKNLAATFIVPWPSNKLDLLKNIPQTTSLAVIKMLNEFGIEGKLKWINDVMVSNKKICGILNNHVGGIGKINGENYDRVFIGVGINMKKLINNININQPITSIEEELPYNQEFPDIETVFEKLTYHFYILLNSLLEEGFPKLKDEIQQKLCWVNSLIEINTGQDRLEGTYLGINDDGYLILKTNGKKDIFQLGHISRIK